MGTAQAVLMALAFFGGALTPCFDRCPGAEAGSVKQWLVVLYVGQRRVAPTLPEGRMPGATGSASADTDRA
jgi:hypothetical protein